MLSFRQLRLPQLTHVQIGALWLLACCSGVSLLWHYSSRPSRPANPPEWFPKDSSLELAAEGLTVIMLAHPQCPCTRASLRELDRLMADCEGELTTYVLFYEPQSMNEAWTRSSLWQQAKSIPGVIVRTDEEGRETSRLGALTSGQVIVYDSRGQLAFRGGITPGRGHSGDNFGRSAILRLARGESEEEAETPVYGCPIMDELANNSESGEPCNLP